MNDKPVLVIKDHLLLPVKSTMEQCKNILGTAKDARENPILLNGLYLMAVAYVESMQREILAYYFTHNPAKIKKGGKGNKISVSKQALFGSEGFSLIENLAKDYVRDLRYNELLEAFNANLGITSNNDEAIKKIQESRNDLIHFNTSYNYKQKQISEQNVNYAKLVSDIEIYQDYLRTVKQSISSKFVRNTKLKALENLWHYTFRTPLCANFEDYWQVDRNRDTITQCLNPEIEHGLSSSEEFMLGIWRSQWNSRPMEFINMASLDRRNQNCFYLFLKLMNDIFIY